jgi:hypothetical protein
MAVNVKMGVDIGGFTSGIKQGQQILKGLNAELKASESEFKATGNAEQKLASQTKTLTSQLNVQKGIADQARAALKAMTDAGVDPTDAAYQRLYVTLMNAEAGANDALAALNALKGGTENAKQGADDLTDSLKGIGKKISLEQVKNGINSITTGLENAAKKAVQLGEQLWNTIMDSAKRADDTATMAEMYGIDLDTFMRMQKLVENGLDTSVESILASQKKLKKGIGKESKETAQALKELGLAFSTDRGGWIAGKDSLDLMFRAGQALKKLSSETEREAKAQAIFGRSWEELVPLFNQYQTVDEYREALAGVTVNSEDTIRDLAALNDAVSALESSWTTLKDELIGAIAPELTKGADAISGLLDKLTEYLKTDEGQEMLKRLGTAVSGLFDDLGKISPEQVVEGFSKVFTTLVDKITWLSEHWGEVKTAIEGIGTAFLTMKGISTITSMITLIDALKSIGLFGGAKAAETAAEVTGAQLAAEVSASTVMSGLQAAATNGMPVADWLLNSTPAGTQLQNLVADLLGQEKQFADIDIAGEVKKGIQESVTGTGEADGSIPLYRAAVPFVDVGRQIQNAQDPNASLGETLLNPIGWLAPWLYLGRVGNKGNQTSAEDIAENIGDLDLPADVEIPDDTALMLEEEIGTVDINGVVHFVDEEGNSVTPGSFDAPPLHKPLRRKKANGIWSVPYDGYLAQLHRGERVVPAREVQSRSYNSNLYVESMYMSSGMDAAGLASAMAAAQRRQMSGYGS